MMSGRFNCSSNPIAFVGGCPRSGTTLLQRMLDSHPQLACANDTHFIPRVLEKHQPAALAWAIGGREIPLTNELVVGTLGYHRFYRLGVSADEAQAAAEQATTYQAFVRHLYDCVAEHHAKTYAAEKTPDYVRHTHVLAGLFPQSRFVHIWRDGRDVVLSLLDWATPTKGPGSAGAMEIATAGHGRAVVAGVCVTRPAGGAHRVRSALSGPVVRGPVAGFRRTDGSRHSTFGPAIRLRHVGISPWQDATSPRSFRETKLAAADTRTSKLAPDDEPCRRATLRNAGRRHPGAIGISTNARQLPVLHRGPGGTGENVVATTSPVAPRVNGSA